jgi:GT2 family glycosyltransferase/glycosyltransferase involved in cell wall biosynthesis
MISSHAGPCIIIFVWNNPPLISSCLKLGTTLSELGYAPFYLTPSSDQVKPIIDAGYGWISVQEYIQKFSLPVVQELQRAMSIENNAIIFRGINVTEDTWYESECIRHGRWSPLGCDSANLLPIYSIIFLDAFERLLTELKAVACYLWNGLVYPPKALKTICKTKHIPVFCLERGLLPDRLVVDPVGINFGGSLGGKNWELLLANQAGREHTTAKNYIAEYRLRKQSIVNHGVYLDKYSLYTRLGIPLSKRIILFPNQIDTDTNIFYYSPYYKTNISVLKELVLATRQLPDAFIIVKSHPEDTETSLDGLNELLGRSGIVVTDIALPALIESAYAIVVRNSTVGLEGVLFNKPVIVLGQSAYSGKGFTYDVTGTGEILLKLESFWGKKEPSLLSSENLEQFVLYLLTNYHFELSTSLESQQHNSIFIANQLKTAGLNPCSLTMEDSKKATPLVSVIVPTHNRPDMLNNAIRSILDQAFQDFEIIVINDAGQDIKYIIDSFQSTKILYLSHETNKGLAATRNTGIQAARGKYIAYLDDDDMFYPDHLETLVKFLEESDYKVAYTDAYRATQKKDGEQYTTIRRDLPYSSDFDYDRILTENFIPVLCVMHKKVCLKDAGMFDESLSRHEDWDLWIRMSRIHRFAHIPRITCEYTIRLDGSGMVSGSVPLFLRTFTKICEKYRHLTEHRPEIVAARVQSRFQILLDVFHFLGERINALSEVDADAPTEEIFSVLRKTGATDAEIASAFYQQTGIRLENTPEKAAAFFNKALEIDSDNVIARHKLAVMLLQMGDQEGAVQQLEKLFEQHPYDPGIVGSLARFFPVRDDQKASFYLERLIELNPDDIDAVRLMEEVKNRLGCSTSAIKHSVELPLKVGVFSLEAPGDACAAIRITGPLEMQGERVQLLWGAVSDGTICTTNLDMMNEADIILVQRFYPRQGTIPYIEKMLASGKPVIYEADDLLIDLPVTNHLKPWAEETATLLRSLLPRFTAITVSTPHLSNVFASSNPNIFVLPNLIDENLFHPVPRKAGGPVVIGFCGTGTHARDLELIETALFRIAEKYGDQVAFFFMGYANSRYLTLPGFTFRDFERDYTAYAQALSGSGIDIALVPLEDNQFNRCKSNIKWLEYSACGYAGIYADLPPYNKSVEHGRTGLLVGNNPQQWYDAICLLIENPELRRSISSNTREEVLSRYSLAINAHKWLDTYQTIISKHTAAEPAKRVKVSILVLTWNRARMLDQCLATIANNIYNSESYELIVGDNGSAVDTQEVLAKYKIHKLIRRETNEGLELYKELYAVAEGDLIIEIDDDVIELPLHFDRDMERYFEAFPEYGLLGLDVIQNEHTNGAKPDGRYYGRDFRNDLEIEQGPVIGCCMAIRRSLFNSFGGFSGETLSLARSQDWVLADRVKKLGMHTGIMRGIKCHHARGPYYAAQYDRQALEVEKYRASGLHEHMASYASFTRNVSADNPLLPLPAPVSIIIPLFNNMAYTRHCLEQIRQNTSGEQYELILVDNGSTDNTYTLFESLTPPVKVIRNLKNQGFAKACNQGAREASGKYLLFLNNDTEPKPGWLEPLIDIADHDPTVAAVGSKLLYPDETIQHAGVSIIDNRREKDPLRGEHIWRGRPAGQPEANQLYCYQALTAACLLVKRDAFEAVGGFDEGYWNGYEDVDLCFKLGQKGWKLVYQPASIVIHHESKSGAERFAGVSRNIQRLHEKWQGKIQPDIIIHGDGRAVEGAGISSGFMAPYVMEAVVTAPLVSIIIPLFNQAHLTKACVEAIQATAGSPECYELILVDNGSRDWTSEYLLSMGNSVVVMTNKDNLGFAKACNQGARIARGEFLLFLNNDTVPQEGWLDALMAGIREEQADIVGAKLLYPNGRVQHAGVAFNRNGIGYHIFKNFPGDAPAVNQQRFMQCVTAACLLVPRQLFNQLGGFDEQFRNGFEDVDFCLRAGQAGKRVLYAPRAVIVHHEEQSEGRKQFDSQNMQRYLSRWQGRVRCDDEELYAAHGLCVEWRENGSCTIQQQFKMHGTTADEPSYPLVPLVGSYAETPLARLSASSRMKAVLKKFTHPTVITADSGNL